VTGERERGRREVGWAGLALVETGKWRCAKGQERKKMRHAREFDGLLGKKEGGLPRIGNFLIF
jgi:hypothetical protein